MRTASSGLKKTQRNPHLYKPGKNLKKVGEDEHVAKKNSPYFFDGIIIKILFSWGGGSAWGAYSSGKRSIRADGDSSHANDDPKP